MGVREAVRGFLGGPRYQATGNASDERFWNPYAGSASSGIAVNADTAMKASAVYACVRLISESMAALPLIMYQRQADGGKRRATNHPLYDLLHDSPCQSPRQTAFQFVSTAMTHLLLRGNAYAQILPGPRGAVDQLRLLNPDKVRVEVVGDNKDVVRYQVRQATGQEQPFNAEDIFHLTGLSLDGITGVSIITYARESIGLALAAEGYAARVFSQDATPRGVLQAKGRLSQEAIERLRASWADKHSGLTNAHKPAILEEGLEWKGISMTAEDAQMISSREFQNSDIARVFNVPLHLIQENSKSTSWGSGLQELTQGFYGLTLLPWMRRWEDTISQQLITNPRLFFAEFFFNALLRVNLQERYAAYAIGRGNGWLTVNDILRFENMNPIGPEGDTRLQAVNMAPLGWSPPPAPPSGRDGGAVGLPPPTNGAVHLPTEPGALDLLKELVHADN